MVLDPEKDKGGGGHLVVMKTAETMNLLNSTTEWTCEDMHIQMYSSIPGKEHSSIPGKEHNHSQGQD